MPAGLIVEDACELIGLQVADGREVALHGATASVHDATDPHAHMIPSLADMPNAYRRSVWDEGVVHVPVAPQIDRSALKQPSEPRKEQTGEKPEYQCRDDRRGDAD